jgi:hypothetical protein
MTPIKTIALAAIASLAAVPVAAETISNPVNSYSFPYLSGALVGGQQTQYVGQSFTAPITGALTNFQFTLNTSSLQSVYGAVFAWDGSRPTTELWRSADLAGSVTAPTVFSFDPTGVTLTAGQSYVAFLGTYGIADNSGLATVGTCLAFVGCGSNAIPNLGVLVSGTVYADGVVFNQAPAFDATFSVTVAAAAVPEPAGWALMIGGIGAAGAGLRRRKAAGVRYA